MNDLPEQLAPYFWRRYWPSLTYNTDPAKVVARLIDSATKGDDRARRIIDRAERDRAAELYIQRFFNWGKP